MCFGSAWEKSTSKTLINYGDKAGKIMTLDGSLVPPLPASPSACARIPDVMYGLTTKMYRIHFTVVYEPALPHPFVASTFLIHSPHRELRSATQLFNDFPTSPDRHCARTSSSHRVNFACLRVRYVSFALSTQSPGYIERKSKQPGMYNAIIPMNYFIYLTIFYKLQ